MLLQRRWSHADWKHDDERRFQLTLGLSVLLHALLLLAWKLPPQVWKVADHAVLTVVLRATVPMSQSSPAIEQERKLAVLVQKEPAPAAFSAPPKSVAPGAVVAPAAHSPSSLAATQARVAAQPAPGRISNSPQAPVGVTVLLVVGAEGRVEQIFWNQLPALTNEQLRRVEATIREKTYAPRQTLNEVIDVRSILKLPPVRPEESPLPQPPVGE